MADVIPLAPRRRPQARSCALPQASAEILFFTGVRYERAAEPAPQVTMPQVTVPQATLPQSRRPAPSKTLGRRKARQPA